MQQPAAKRIKLLDDENGAGGGSGSASAGMETKSSMPDASQEKLEELSSKLKGRHSDDEDDEQRLTKMSAAVKTLLECLGEDPSRDGLKKTPLRMAKALLFCTNGYSKTLNSIVNGAIFEEDHTEMVVVKDITIHSLCEHHMVPFTGKVLFPPGSLMLASLLIVELPLLVVVLRIVSYCVHTQ